MSQLLKEFQEYIYSQIPNLLNDSIIIVYGSTAYGKENSDLDVVFILPSYDIKIYNLIKKCIIQFQIENNMIIDEEVPYENKLVYSFDELNDILNYSLFKNGNQYCINPIVISKDYFSSKEMKYRLMLNILTTYSKTISGNKEMINQYKLKAWKNIIAIVSSYYNLESIVVEDFIESLYIDKKTGSYGEDFLGYKKSNPELYGYIKENLTQTLEQLVNEKKLVKKDINKYILRKN